MERNLIFQKDENNFYVAKSVVNSDYAIRVEMKDEGMVIVLQSSFEEREGVIKDRVSYGKNGIHDEDYDAIVYPKFITIKTTAEPSFGAIKEAE